MDFNFTSYVILGIDQAGPVTVSIPEPQFLQSSEKGDDGGTRSPKYPSTVTKVYK